MMVLAQQDLQQGMQQQLLPLLQQRAEMQTVISLSGAAGLLGE